MSDAEPHFQPKMHLNGVLLSAPALRVVGGLREDFFVGHEDRELALRLVRAGWPVVRDPLAVVGHRHKGIGRRGPASVLRYFYAARNEVYLDVHVRKERFATASAVLKTAGVVARTAMSGTDRRRRIRARISATRDGIRGDLGRKDYPFLAS